MSVDDTVPSDLATAPRPYESPRRGTGFFTVFIMSLLAAGGGAGLALFAQTQPAFTRLIGLPSTSTAALPADATLRADIEQLKVRLADLEAKGAMPAAISTETSPSAVSEAPPAIASGATPDAASAGDASSLRAEVQGLAGRLTGIETRLGALDPTGAGGAMIAALQADVAALKVTVEALRAAAASGPAPGVAFAAISLAEASSRPGPFLAEWEAMRAALPGNPAIEGLAAVARTGAPTRNQLVERFGEIADGVRRAARAEEAGSGIGGWFASLWRSLIVVRSTDPGAGDGPDAVVARAEKKLAEGEFAGAVDEVSRLSGKAAEPALEWLRQGRARLEIESRIATIRGTIERSPASPPPAPALPLTTPPQKQPLPAQGASR